MKKILIAEDEANIARVLELYLKKAGYQTEVVHDGGLALEAFERFQPSLVLLDMMMPNMDGWTVLQHIREKSACPVIILTSLTQTEQKLRGLDRGADDYMTKPFHGEEVVARVNAVLRRTVSVLENRNSRMYGSLKIDFSSRQVFLRGTEIVLSPRDLAVLLALAERPKHVFSREQLIELVWGLDYEGSDRAVDLAIKRIRQALAEWGGDEGEIKTLHRIGYQFMIHG